MASKPNAASAFATAIAALLITQSATAVTPTATAVWDCAVAEQELNTTQGGLTIKANSGVTVSDKITISYSAWGGAYIELPSDLSKVSVLVKYSNFSGFTDYQYYGGNSFYAPQFMAVYDSKSRTAGLRGLNSANNFQWYAITTYISTVGGPTFPAASGYALFAYNNARGMYLATGTSVSNMTGSENADSRYYFNDGTISKLGLGGSPDGEYGVGWPGLIIEKVALFTGEYYTAADVAEYEFPSEVGMYKSDVNVSTINAAHTDETEIDVYLADGVTVTGDTTFTATKVNFHCEGSFYMTPPANNEATFDFSTNNVTGSPVIIYAGAFPSFSSGTTFTANSIPTNFVTDSAQWTGTIWIKNANAVDFAPNNFGNASSTVRLSGVSGYFANDTVSCDPAIELVNDTYSYGLNVNDGYSRDGSNPYRRVTINTLKGSGALWTGDSAPTVLFNVLDWSGYTGSIQLVNKIVVFGSTVPSVSEFNTAGAIYVGSGATVTLPAQWRADGGIHVYGTLESDSMDKIRAADTANNIPATRIVTYDTGMFTVKGAGGTRQFNVDYSQVTGNGTLKFEGSNWFTLPSNNTISTNLTLCPARTSGLVIPPGGITVGSLAGSGDLRSDLEAAQGGVATQRDFTIVQSKDTAWSGIFSNGDRIGTIYVKPGESAGTLTLSGTQTADNNLVVESGAKVNLTGTWVGATTTAGTLGGTGAITGDLTLSDGATFNVANLSDPLTVEDGLSMSGNVTIRLPAGTSTSCTIITTGNRPKIDGVTFDIYVGDTLCKTMHVTATDNGLKVVPNGFIFKLQ